MKGPLHVLIVGGGIGGLCLAQGLRRNGVSVAVFERDRTPDARLQGYRLNIEPVGSAALHACLPPSVWQLLIATAGDPGPRMGVFDQQLRELMQEDEPGATSDPAKSHHAVSRVTLRRLLLTGLEDVVTFDKHFTRYEAAGSTVTAFFSDGSSATGDALIGADGIRSRVRKQLLPNAREIDTPAFGVGGKLPITPETAAWLPAHMMKTKNMILPPRDFLFTAAFRRRVAAEHQDPENDYVMWAFVANRRTFAAPPTDLRHLELRQLIESRVRSWHPTLQRLIAETDPSTVQAFDFAASADVEPWTEPRVTLLGDALHYMPPVGGMGGNAALRDAQLLTSALMTASRGEKTLHTALRQCEEAMIAQGFAAVHASLWYTRLAISRVPGVRSVARMFFRLCGAVPALRRTVFGASQP